MGEVPAKFLGIPLITQKLKKKKDCHPLIVRITSRVETWTARFLSFAGRLQLVKSVLHAIKSYWSMHFLIPKGIINHIQMLFSQFLWNGNLNTRSKAKVSWVDVTFEEGGLGIKDAHKWNKSLILKHLLFVINPNSMSLWADWVKKTIIIGAPF
ncbi:hypothetical protein POM88_037110 [Heracleum sosnowskyi]|uniref:Uncharacterized protein n=1 Tax=Heracleum sosnowskyi TaxID=360622 RepID=A0AAD8HQI1_9APIA|nr:hypothetical protein POM88_037110 [Heracleum sosnowskyi]